MATPGLTDCHQQVVKLRMCEKKLLQAASLQAGEEDLRLTVPMNVAMFPQVSCANSIEYNSEQCS